MNVLHISTYSHGGAAMACIRLHEGLLNKGVNSKVLFLYKSTNKFIPQSYSFKIAPPPQPTLLSRILNKLRKLKKIQSDHFAIKKEIKKMIPEKIEWFSFADSGYDITTDYNYQEADIIHLHWVSDFLDYNFFLKNKKPIIWTLHDMNPFTGGCHYSGNCYNFQDSCECCPQLESSSCPTYSHSIFDKKFELLSNAADIHIVALSKWMLNISLSSKLFKKFPHYLIPNGLSKEIYKPRDKKYSRELLGLPLDKKIILFVSFYSLNIKRKGYQYLIDALNSSNFTENVILCTVGGNSDLTIDNIPVIQLGNVNDERLMSAIYSACDLFIIPSIEDNLPNTILESLMCGTPVLGFPAGGIKEIIKNGENGILCEKISIDSLIGMLLKFIKGEYAFSREKIRMNSVLNYDIDIQANSFSELYNQILKK
jgi:glycosyltransferase involved in cell wall biosynthesis